MRKILEMIKTWTQTVQNTNDKVFTSSCKMIQDAVSHRCVYVCVMKAIRDASYNTEVLIQSNSKLWSQKLLFLGGCIVLPAM